METYLLNPGLIFRLQIVPSSWVKLQLACPSLTDLQASLFWGSMPSRLHTSTSCLTHSLQDFLGLPRPLGSGMEILVIEFVQEDARATRPYHLRRLVLRATATS